MNKGAMLVGVENEGMPSAYEQRVGERLRAVRKQKHLSLQAVEAESDHEFKASVLGAYERGERTISVPRLQRLAKFYNVPVDQLLPKVDEQVGATIDLRDDSDRAVEEERITIDLPRLESLMASDRDLLVRYLSLIQVQRGDFNGRVLTIRNEDLRALATLFDTTPESMRRRLDDLDLRIRT
jgi:transcriptional regulator with XRE-family HTH domain